MNNLTPRGQAGCHMVAKTDWHVNNIFHHKDKQSNSWVLFIWVFLNVDKVEKPDPGKSELKNIQHLDE